MKVWFKTNLGVLYNGDVLEVLQEFLDESIDYRTTLIVLL